MTEIQEKLFSLADDDYRDFHSRLMPTVDPKLVIGVRVPKIRALAKETEKTQAAKDFIAVLPHKYYEENNLHSCLIAKIKDFDECMTEVERFLPFIDNWATCDMLSPKVFKKHRPELLERIKVWIRSEHTYTIRFGIEMLMSHFLDEDFSEEYPALAASVISDEYYVNMMIAWYFATALAKQYDTVLPYIEEHRLPEWVHRKTIQKAAESFRITDAQKKYLRTLR